MDGADVCGTSSRASRRPPNVTCGAAILDPRWRRRKWHQPGLGASFSIPIEGEVQNGDPSASGGHLGWPHLRNRKWGHPRWPPEAEGPPFCTSPSMGIEKLALYYCYFSMLLSYWTCNLCIVDWQLCSVHLCYIRPLWYGTHLLQFRRTFRIYHNMFPKLSFNDLQKRWSLHYYT